MIFPPLLSLSHIQMHPRRHTRSSVTYTCVNTCMYNNSHSLSSLLKILGVFFLFTSYKTEDVPLMSVRNHSCHQASSTYTPDSNDRVKQGSCPGSALVCLKHDIKVQKHRPDL